MNTTNTTSTARITSLGLGSNNILSDDLLDKLKKADEVGIINPVNKDIKKNEDKSKNLNEIVTLIKNFRNTAKELSSDLTYEKRDVAANGKSAQVTAKSGVALQSFSIDVKQLAKKDSYQSLSFNSPNGIIGITQNGSLNIEIDKNTYKIEVSRTTTYQDLVDKINDKTNGQVQARIIKTGSENSYQLVISSAKTGKDQVLKFSEESSDKKNPTNVLSKLLLDEKNIKKNRLSTASDAIFEYEGLKITRKSNDFDDLKVGLNVSLKEKGKTHFDITRDSKDVVKKIKDVVDNYNSLINNLETSTLYDEENKTTGIFQGVSEISSIRSNLSRILNTQSEIGVSLNKFGLSLNKNGILELDESKLNDGLKNNFDQLKDLFAGNNDKTSVNYIGTSAVKNGSFSIKKFTINGKEIELNGTEKNTSEQNAIDFLNKINEKNIPGLNVKLSKDFKFIFKTEAGFDLDIKGNDVDLANIGIKSTKILSQDISKEGVFSKLEKALSSLVQDKKGSLSIYQEKLKKDTKELSEEKQRSQETLNKKYETIRARFIAYDQAIAKLNNQFASLQSLIDAQISSKK